MSYPKVSPGREREPPAPLPQLSHQHPHLLLPQLQVQGGVQEGLQEDLKRKKNIVWGESEFQNWEERRKNLIPLPATARLKVWGKTGEREGIGREASNRRRKGADSKGKVEEKYWDPNWGRRRKELFPFPLVKRSEKEIKSQVFFTFEPCRERRR